MSQKPPMSQRTIKELADDYTCDLCDIYETVPECVNFRVLNSNPLRHYGGKTKFHGRIQTVYCPRDNSKVKEQLSLPGDGRILVVNGNEDLSVSFLGDRVALQAVTNGWNGVIVLGAIRDCRRISQMDLGVLAMGRCPLRTTKEDLGHVGQPLIFFGTGIQPNEYLYVDDTGILVSSTPLMDEAK